MADNPVRPCYGCNAFDSDPRHQIDLGGGKSEDLFHIDCCAEKRGCSVCRSFVDGATSAGLHLRDHLRSLPLLAIDHQKNDDAADPHDLTTATVTEV